MLRAWMVTADDRFRRAALAAIGGFDRATSEGGFVAEHVRARVPYLEEYPSQPTGVLNGFLASLFGLWELARWLEDDRASRLFGLYRASADAMLPHYTTSWWTLYDLDPESPFPNVHSPRYHRLATDYLRVLSAIAPSEAILAFRDRWIAMDHPVSRLRAAGLKVLKKLLHR
jgi:heparosan-N-sulfate-glucuronate 5-epimerase